MARPMPTHEDGKVQYLLIYDVVDDYLERRQPLRAEHFALAEQYVARGQLLLGGAAGEPVEHAVLVFRAASEDVPAGFAQADPYVKHGIVTRWRVLPWHTVAGTLMAGLR